MEVYNTVQEVMIKIIPKKKKCKKAKWFSEEALQTAEKRREAKGKGGQDRSGWSPLRRPPSLLLPGDRSGPPPSLGLSKHLSTPTTILTLL